MKSLKIQYIVVPVLIIAALAPCVFAADEKPLVPLSPPAAAGPFQPTWESLKRFQPPEWFRDAKFGIWAHWNAQSVPEMGDWYANYMYVPGGREYKYHVAHYGHPSKFGFKDIINLWHAEKWDSENLIALYKKAGAKYFVALANHCDNFDCWDSKYQPWNSMRVGPKKDIVGDWARAARAAGLRFGVSVHASHAWSWLEKSQGADKDGPLAGVPFDGKLTRADGKGLWWDSILRICTRKITSRAPVFNGIGIQRKEAASRIRLIATSFTIARSI